MRYWPLLQRLRGGQLERSDWTVGLIARAGVVVPRPGARVDVHRARPVVAEGLQRGLLSRGGCPDFGDAKSCTSTRGSGIDSRAAPGY